MIWIRKKEEVRISALLALFFFPLSFVGMFLMHGIPVFQVLLLPILLVIELLENLIGPLAYILGSLEDMLGTGPAVLFGWTTAIMIQYFGYFLFIYLSFKILRKMKITGEPSPVKEESKKEQDGP